MERLSDGQPLRAALRSLSPEQRAKVRPLLDRIGGPERCLPVLAGITGARSDANRLETIWTMPGSLPEAGPLTTSTVRLVEGARQSVTCSTFNFQRSSALWQALSRAAQRPRIAVRVYLDADAVRRSTSSSTPTVGDIAEHLYPGMVLQTRPFDGGRVRNHAKFVVVDHRFVLVTSANLSWSAEYGNIELGVRVDDPALAESIERQLLDVEGRLFEQVHTIGPA